MSVAQENYGLNGKIVNVFCKDGQVITGYWSEVFSADDNAYLAEENDREPPGESILIDAEDGVPVEIYVAEIERIEKFDATIQAPIKQSA